MPIQDFDIVGSYNNQRVSEIDAERSVNVFEYQDPLGKKPKTLINTSGLIDQALVFTGATGGFRAQFVFNGDEYNVIGTNIFIISSLGLITSFLSVFSTLSGYVGIDANTFQVIFVDGDKGFIYDTNALTLEEITDTSFPAKPIDVCYLDGFFIVANGDTNTFEMSSFQQGMVWGPASNEFTTNFTVNSQLTIGTSTIGQPTNTDNYATGIPVTVTNSGGALPTPLATDTIYYVIRIDSTHIELALTYDDAIAGTFIPITNDGSGTQTVISEGQLQQGAMTSHPGTITGCRTLHRRIFFFSQFYIEVWENAGAGTNLPIRRNNSLLIEYGNPAIGAIATGFDTLIFQSQSRDGLGPVMQILGTQAIPISTRALDFQLAQYAAENHISDCRAFMIKENGIIFYRMNFTAANHTFVYNLTQSNPQSDETKYWHEEEVLNGDRHPAQTHAYFNGINYVGNYAEPILYAVDSATYTNAGEKIRRMRITKAIVPPGYQRMRIDRLQVDLLQGAEEPIDLISAELDLLTEDGLILLTESGLDILLEQASDESNMIAPSRSLFMSISKDGGQSYGYRLRAEMGAIGQRTFRTLFRKLGTTKRGQAFVAKFEFFDAVPFVVLGAAWFVDVLPE